jgi:hypothetical protein
MRFDFKITSILVKDFFNAETQRRRVLKRRAGEKVLFNFSYISPRLRVSVVQFVLPKMTLKYE